MTEIHIDSIIQFICDETKLPYTTVKQNLMILINYILDNRTINNQPVSLDNFIDSNINNHNLMVVVAKYFEFINSK
jgi:hypothetical protein